MSDFDYKMLVHMAGEMICIANSTHFVFVNPSFEQNLGWKEEELLSMPFSSLLHPDDVKKTQDAVDLLEQGEQIAKFINRYKHKNGTWRYLEWYSRPIGDVYYATARDVTGRIRQESQREQTLLLLEESLKISHSGYFSLKLSTMEIFFSKETHRILGSMSEIDDVPYVDLIERLHPDDVEHVKNIANHALMQGESFSVLSRIRYADSLQHKLVQVMGFPVFVDQKLVSIFGLIRDMTHDEAMLRQEELELFARVASHDLRAPLRQISMLLEIMSLESDVFNYEPLKEYFGHVQSATKRLYTLVDDLSRYVIAGQYDTVTSVHISTVLEQVLKDLNPLIEAQNAVVTLPKQCPHVLANSSGLYHVFQNLIANSLKFGQEIENLAISIQVEKLTQQYMEISVHDNGPGLTPGMEKKVFQPFQQVDRRDLGGSGIGLSIVKRIVERYHGNVWVTSSPGQGCTFFIRLLRPSS